MKIIALLILLFCGSWKAAAQNPEDIDLQKGEAAMAFLKAGAFSKFENSIGLIKNKFNQTSYLNMAACALLKSKAHLVYAEKVAQKTVQLYDSYKDNPLARPANFPLEDWNRFMKMAAYPYYETYAQTLYANGKNDSAFFYIEKAMKDQDQKYMELSSIELYTALLESQHQEDKAYHILLKMAETGRSDTNMNLRLKRLYIKITGHQTDASAFLDSIHRNVTKRYKAETAAKMISDLDAPDFSLSDLNGKSVSLSALKGKLVVLDFWATWCMPCKASMPAMEKLTRKYPDVIFLFIATQESGRDARTRVGTFVKKHKYQLNVLMDIPSKHNQKMFSVAAAYKVKGIPAKMVIDKNGKLRFTAEGYSSDTELTNELEAMIAIAKEQ